MRDIAVYIYQVLRLPEQWNNITGLFNRFNLESDIQQNIVNYGDDSLLLIIDSNSNGLLNCRLLKLRRSLIPNILNSRTKLERDILLRDNDFIKEESHFIWNVIDALIFGQYNYNAIRHFSLPLMHYLSTVLDDDDVDIRPARDEDTFRRMREDNRPFKKIEYSVSQESLTTTETERGIPIIRSLLGLKDDNNAIIKITISAGRGRGKVLNNQQISRVSETLIGRSEDLYSLKVYSDNSKYDLLNENLLRYAIRVNEVGGRIESSDFYSKARLLNQIHIINLRRRFRRD